jgi:hypothetical protein
VHGLQVHPVAEAIAGGMPIRSTRIREAIVGGDLTGAARLLARPYALVGTLQGDQVRLQPSEAAVPPPGVYRARVGVAGRPEGRLPLVGRLTTVRVNADGLTITLVRPDAADRRFEGGPDAGRPAWGEPPGVDLLPYAHPRCDEEMRGALGAPPM